MGEANGGGVTGMIEQPRSDCPINRALEVLGDRWSLLVLRDIALHDRRGFRELLARSEEQISAPMLARRLADLTRAGFLTKQEVPRGHQGRYSLTERGTATLPLLLELGRVGAMIDPSTARHLPDSERRSSHVDEIRRRHGLDASPGGSGLV